MNLSGNDSYFDGKKADERTITLRQEAERDQLARQAAAIAQEETPLASKPARRTLRPLAWVARKALRLIVGTVLVAVLLGSVGAVHAQGGVQLDPDLGVDDPAALAFGMGFNTLTRGDFNGAVRWFTEAITYKPDWASAYAGRALSHDLLGNYENALADYSHAVELSPGYASAYNYRGRLYLKLGEYELALADTATAREADPAYAGPYWTEGDIYFTQGRYDEALASYERYLALAGDEADEAVMDHAALCRSTIAASSVSWAGH